MLRGLDAFRFFVGRLGTGAGEVLVPTYAGIGETSNSVNSNSRTSESTPAQQGVSFSSDQLVERPPR